MRISCNCQRQARGEGGEVINDEYWNQLNYCYKFRNRYKVPIVLTSTSEYASIVFIQSFFNHHLFIRIFSYYLQLIFDLILQI